MYWVQIWQNIWIGLQILGKNDTIFLMIWPLFLKLWYLNINDIGIMIIKLCPIYWTPGHKAPWKVSNIMDARTQEDMTRKHNKCNFDNGGRDGGRTYVPLIHLNTTVSSNKVNRNRVQCTGCIQFEKKWMMAVCKQTVMITITVTMIMLTITITIIIIITTIMIKIIW